MAARIIFFGTTGAFSASTLDALLAEIIPAAVVLPALSAHAKGLRHLRAPATAPVLGRRLPAYRQALPTIVTQAHVMGIPVYELGNDASAVEGVRALMPQLCAVACWPKKVTPSLLAVPRLGWLNVHPALLPRHRGPDPLFWTFHAGETETGVTVHQMAEALDTGDIVAQQRVTIAPGEAEAALEQRLATAGGALLAEAIRALTDGTAVFTPQDESQASWEGWPTADDYTVRTGWSARRAYVFATGMRERAEPVTVAINGKVYRIAHVVGYEETGAYASDEPRIVDASSLFFSRPDGVMSAHVIPEA
ncbi:MAG TPA: formyltransferase family protein [Ktedonobacterales bacterium]